MHSKKEEHICVLCGKLYTGYGNNAEPLSNGRCCNYCNASKVLPYRISRYKINKDRPTWHSTFIRTAELIAEHSTCIRKKVGAVLVQDKRIISIGYNGTPCGHEHCSEHFKDMTEEQIQVEHHSWSNSNELHAELNCILYAGTAARGGAIYCTLSPCINCAKTIIAAGIKTVVYKEVYKDTDGLDLLAENGINIIQHK